MTTTASGLPADLAQALPLLDGLMPADAARLRPRLHRLARTRDPQRRAADFLRLSEDLTRAEARLDRRRDAVPRIAYPDLPVSARRDDIVAALRENQVLVVAGETGSGKTTQLPKMLLETGRGVRGMIGHTQPRRIAARSVAERLAEELGVELGGAVGYTVRFDGSVGADTLVRVMTDGVLLAEIHDDPDLLRYDAIVIDEAHERSLTIDVLLGYLTRLLPRRPDLQLVITSATIDPGRFAEHFGGAPVLEVSGRTFPVEIRYRPFGVVEDGPDEDADAPLPGAAAGQPWRRDDADHTEREADDRDVNDAICDAVAELAAAGPGDVLVFCAGERDIREAADALAARAQVDPLLRGIDIVPLYARLSAAEQHQIFAPHSGRRVVVSTNVAETSLTVPGIRYVVDTGLARISRYNRRTKVQRLPIEPVSQASARQRAGRCGRVADGICIRLYSQEDHDSRPAFTDPEILRTNLASVVLRMAALEVGAVEDFPFVDPPDRRAIRDAVALLEELGAVESVQVDDVADGGSPAGAAVTAPSVTAIGRALSRLPVDPRYGRMLVAADQAGCLDDAIVLVAGLSIIDVRERPREEPERGKAVGLHRRFDDPASDLLSLLALWRYAESGRRALSNSAWRRRAKAEYLHHRRLREWADLVSQIRSVTRDLGWAPSTVGLVAPADAEEPTVEPAEAPAGDAAERLHRAVLPGLLSHVGMRLDEVPRPGREGGRTQRDQRSAAKEGEQYQGARGARFVIDRSSALAKRRPRWVMAVELVETGRISARQVAGVDPRWVEAAGDHLLVRSYSEPRWDRRQARVVATERVTLYGLPLVTGRAVPYAQLDPAGARDLFVRHALVLGEWQGRHPFLRRNQEVLAEAARIEERTRRRDALISEDELVAWFAERVPAGVGGGRDFDGWWKRYLREHGGSGPDGGEPGRLLALDLDTVLRRVEGPAAGDYPETWRDPATGADLPLAYRFAPGEPDDGVTVTVPLERLGQVDLDAFAWQVPGLQVELVTELVRSLPKALRRSFAPAATFAGAVLDAIDGEDRGPLLPTVADRLSAMGGVRVTAGDLDASRLPDHLRMRVRVVAPDGSVVALDRDLASLRARLGRAQQDAVSALAGRLERVGLRTFPVERVPESVRVDGPSGPVVLFGALAAEDTDGARVAPATRVSAAVRVYGTREEAAAAMPGGVVELLLAAVPSPAKALVAGLSTPDKLQLATPPGTDTAGLLVDVARAAVADLARPASWPRTTEAFADLLADVAPGLPVRAASILQVVVRVCAAAAEAEAALGAVERAVAPTRRSPELADAVSDMRAQLDDLLGPRWVSRTGAARLPHLLRHLQAVQRRAEAVREDPRRDAELLGRWRVGEAAVAAAHRVTARRSPVVPAAVRDLRWMLEEFRVALWAQPLGTAHPVSEQRIIKAAQDAVRA